VHRHAADEEHGAAAVVSRIGHHGAEWEPSELPRMRGQASDAAERCERACALCERRFGDFGTSGAGAGVLSRGHQSMVAESRVKDDTRRSALTQAISTVNVPQVPPGCNLVPHQPLQLLDLGKPGLLGPRPD
jgi:hypothetical protein